MTADRLVKLKHFLKEFYPDIVSIQELKLNQEQVNLYLNFDGYTVQYKPRKLNPTKGGSVAVVIKIYIANSVIVGLDDSKENVGIRACVSLYELIKARRALRANKKRKKPRSMSCSKHGIQ